MLELHYATIDMEISNFLQVFPIPVLDQCTNEVMRSAFCLMYKSQ